MLSAYCETSDRQAGRDDRREDQDEQDHGHGQRHGLRALKVVLERRVEGLVDRHEAGRRDGQRARMHLPAQRVVVPPRLAARRLQLDADQRLMAILRREGRRGARVRQVVRVAQRADARVTLDGRERLRQCVLESLVADLEGVAAKDEQEVRRGLGVVGQLRRDEVARACALQVAGQRTSAGERAAHQQPGDGDGEQHARSDERGPAVAIDETAPTCEHFLFLLSFGR